MTEPAETRESLLIRLGNPPCDEAWNEFALIYRPMILRLARRWGAQSEDAEDIAQQVLMSVAKAIGDWKKDPSKGRFRAWLTTVTKNAVRNAVSRAPRDRASGDSQVRRLLESTSNECELDAMIETEYMRSVFREAARRAESEFEVSTWTAFWMTVADDVEIATVVKRLSMTRGAVYSARSRVMRRLQTIAQELSHEEFV